MRHTTATWVWAFGASAILALSGCSGSGGSTAGGAGDGGAGGASDAAAGSDSGTGSGTGAAACDWTVIEYTSLTRIAVFHNPSPPGGCSLVFSVADDESKDTDGNTAVKNGDTAEASMGATPLGKFQMSYPCKVGSTNYCYVSKGTLTFTNVGFGPADVKAGKLSGKKLALTVHATQVNTNTNVTHDHAIEVTFP